ncbi:RNA transcription, translation and transport factor protein-like [Styela clava]
MSNNPRIHFLIFHFFIRYVMYNMNKAFQRKLSALQFPQASKFNANDDKQFKLIILWIEDQKVRHYKIDERQELRKFEEPAWTKAFTKYLTDVMCPFSSSDKMSALDWLLGLAVRLEYGDNVEKYSKVTGQAVQERRKKASEPVAASSIENISSSDPNFRKGVESMAKALQIPLHEDYMVTLKAIRILVEERLTKSAIEKAKDKKTEKGVTRIPIEDNELGFDTGDEILNDAARALRLLHINELRDLQNKINEAIVSVQTITANPKTDQRLGKVGR